jgi:predicted Mrr-cat superfamily restriction endonuclease
MASAAEAVLYVKEQNAFIFRIAPGADLMQVALENNEIILGWPEAEGLLDTNLDYEHFRRIIHDAYYQNDKDFRRSGLAAGHMHRFIREMQPEDYIVVTYGPEFYVALINGPSFYEALDGVEVEGQQSFYRRSVVWLNDKKPIPRRQSRLPLQSRMKIQGTSANAADLVEEIKELLANSANNTVPTFETDLHNRLVKETLAEIRSGRIENFGFERLIAGVLDAMGATNIRIIPRQLDKGADLLATFTVANAFPMVLAVQAKHYQSEPPAGADVVEQLLNGLVAEQADLGWVVTSGTFSDEAVRKVSQLQDEQGIKIHLINGEDLADLIVRNGFNSNWDTQNKSYS